MEMLTIAGGGTLPVFSFGKEAEMFLRLGTLKAGWEAGRFTTGDSTRCFAGPWRA